MESCNLVVASSALACSITDGKTSEEIDLMAAFFAQLDDTLATLSAQRAFCESKETDES